MTTLSVAVSELDTANRNLPQAQMDYLAAKNRVIEFAQKLQITKRTVLVVGSLAYYIDPPAVSGGDWMVTFGSPPEVIEVPQ